MTPSQDRLRAILDSAVSRSAGIAPLDGSITVYCGALRSATTLCFATAVATESRASPGGRRPRAATEPSAVPDPQHAANEHAVCRLGGRSGSVRVRGRDVHWLELPGAAAEAASTGASNSSSSSVAAALAQSGPWASAPAGTVAVAARKSGAAGGATASSGMATPGRARRPRGTAGADRLGGAALGARQRLQHGLPRESTLVRAPPHTLSPRSNPVTSSRHSYMPFPFPLRIAAPQNESAAGSPPARGVRVAAGHEVGTLREEGSGRSAQPAEGLQAQARAAGGGPSAGIGKVRDDAGRGVDESKSSGAEGTDSGTSDGEGPHHALPQAASSAATLAFPAPMHLRAPGLDANHRKLSVQGLLRRQRGAAAAAGRSGLPDCRAGGGGDTAHSGPQSGGARAAPGATGGLVPRRGLSAPAEYLDATRGVDTARPEPGEVPTAQEPVAPCRVALCGDPARRGAPSPRSHGAGTRAPHLMEKASLAATDSTESDGEMSPTSATRGFMEAAAAGGHRFAGTGAHSAVPGPPSQA